MSIAENLRKIKQTIPDKVTLIAVSKTKPAEAILEAYNAGQRHFGENKVQEMVAKYDVLPKDIHWHLIGHLQTNKVKYIAPFVYLIHSVDSEKLLKEINKRAEQNKRKIAVLLQIHIAKETTKFGLSFSEADQLIQKYAQGLFPNITISGLMGMATNTGDTAQIEKEFESLHHYYLQKTKQFSEFQYLSMGMSNDYLLAIKHGGNMVRVGSAIFGARNYNK